MNSPNVTATGFLPDGAALSCIHCGLCLSSCPTYLITGNENDSPRGRILTMRGMHEGYIPTNDITRRHIDLCLGCRACEAVCPSGVEYGHLLEATREHIERAVKRSRYERILRRLIVGRILPSPSLTRAALAGLRLLRLTRLDRQLPSRLRDLTTLIPTTTPSDELPEYSPTTHAEPLGRVGFLRGCVMSSMFAAINKSTVDLLNLVGYDVIAPRDTGCCGALHAHNGDLSTARDLAFHNCEIIENLNIDILVTNAAGCGSTMKEYGSLLGHTEFRTMDLVEILCETEAFERLSRAVAEAVGSQESDGSQTNITTWHDPCHLAHAQRITGEPRRLVELVAGDRFREMNESDICCGSAGSYNITEPQMAAQLGGRKAENIRQSGATTVVTSNAGCMQQMTLSLADSSPTGGVRIVHIADYLYQAINPSGTSLR